MSSVQPSTGSPPSGPRVSEAGSASAGADDDDLVVYDARDSLPSFPAGPSGSAPNSPSYPEPGDDLDDLISSSRPNRKRSSSLLEFEYRNNLLPLSLSTADGGDLGDEEWATGSRRRVGGRARETRGGEKKSLTLVDGVALTVGLQIGSGIFSSPGVVTSATGSIGSSLIAWAIGGCLAWTGASSFAELGAAVPLNGGAQAYLNYSLGPLASYLFAWTAIVVLKPGSAAIIAIIFGEYVNRVLYHTVKSAGDPHETGLSGIPDWSIKLTACLCVLAITALNACSNRLGQATQVATTFVKLLVLLTVAILGIIQAASQKATPAFADPRKLFEGSTHNLGNYALALYSVVWGYDGWDQSCYVAGEMKNVNRDLPRVIHISLSTVVFLYLVANVSYFVVLPASLVKTTNTVALDFGSALFGKTGAIVFSLLVAFSCFGALNGSTFTSARLVYAAGREGYVPSVFGQMNGITRTPVNALLLQTFLTILFVLFGSGFASLVSFYGVSSWLFYFLTVVGLLVLRVKEPNLPRPYKTWITTPITFSAVALFLLIMPFFSAPLEGVAAIGFILAGLPFYFITQREGRKKLSKIPGLARLVAKLSSTSGSSGRGVYRKAGGGEGAEDEYGEEEEAMRMLPRESQSGLPRPSSAEDEEVAEEGHEGVDEEERTSHRGEESGDVKAAS